MMDTDLFGQWIDVPDDPPVLPPVDEDVISGLKDIATLRHTADLHIDDQIYEATSGLLLQGPCHSVSQSVHAERTAFPPTFDSFPSHVSYSSLCPPALSPDSSPTSIASSTPWLRTPTTDPSFDNVGAPLDALWDTANVEETTIHFLDQSGNSLGDIPSQVQGMMPEDIACTPQTMSDISLPLANTPSFVIFSPYCVSSPQVEAVPPGPTYCQSPAPPSLYTSYLFPVTHNPQETPLPDHSVSPSLSPLSTTSFFSQSPNISTGHLPLPDYSSISPALSPVPLFDSEEKVTVIDSVSSTSARVASVKLPGKRAVGTLGNDLLSYKIPKRSKAKNDDDEWNPGTKHVKRPRAFSYPTGQTATSMPNYLPDESSTCETSQDTEGNFDATHTCCKFCGQGFTRPSDYIRHVENSARHPETRKLWRCPYCDSALGRKDALGRHIRTVHPGKPVFIPEGTSGSHLPGNQKERSMQRMGQRKVLSRRQRRR